MRMLLVTASLGWGACLWADVPKCDLLPRPTIGEVRGAHTKTFELPLSFYHSKPVVPVRLDAA